MTTLLLYRVKDLPEPHVVSVKVKCKHCGEDCWCDAQTAALFMHLEAECIPCFNQIAYVRMLGGVRGA